MKAIVKIVLVTAVISLNSCNKFLDTKPLDFVSPINYYETEEQLNTALNGVYDMLGNAALYGNSMIGLLGLDADEAYFTRATTIIGPEVNLVSASDNNITSFWSACYSGINRANLLLENINKAKGISQANKESIEGEALFLRAYYHFMLVNKFGNVPLIVKSLPDAENTDITQTPAKEVYDQIITDMTKAEALVKPINVIGSGGRISKSSVRGILARVCLYAAGYPVNDTKRYAEARDWAKMVIDDAAAGHTLNPDYSRIFINYAEDKYDYKESIWEIEFWGNQLGAYREGGRTGNNNGIRIARDDFGYTYGFIGTTRTLFNRFEINVDGTSPDLRRDWSIAPFSYVTTTTPATKRPFTTTQIFDRNCGKWRREFELVKPQDKNLTAQNFPVLRFSDVLLMFAEAENEVNNGPTSAAYEAINRVRARAYGKLLPGATNPTQANLSGLNYASFLEAIQAERSRELSFECLRESDLIRWNIYLFIMKQVLADFNAGAPTALKYGALAFQNVTARDIYWPIPSRELGLNKLLKQNNGW